MQYNINREAVKRSALSFGKIDKYKYLTDEEILPRDQRRVTEQAKVAYSPLAKTFQKQTKTIEEQGKKQIDSITNQNKILEALTNKDDHKSIYKEISEKLVKEKFDGIKEIKYETDHDNLIYYFKDNTAKII